MPFLNGKQSKHAVPFFEHLQCTHRPLLLHEQQFPDILQTRTAVLFHLFALVSMIRSTNLHNLDHRRHFFTSNHHPIQSHPTLYTPHTVHTVHTPHGTHLTLHMPHTVHTLCVSVALVPLLKGYKVCNCQHISKGSHVWLRQQMFY